MNTVHIDTVYVKQSSDILSYFRYNQNHFPKNVVVYLLCLRFYKNYMELLGPKCLK